MKRPSTIPPPCGYLKGASFHQANVLAPAKLAVLSHANRGGGLVPVAQATRAAQSRIASRFMEATLHRLQAPETPDQGSSTLSLVLRSNRQTATGPVRCRSKGRITP